MLSPQELLTASFSHPTHELALRETHLSLIVLTGDYAYKIKKAIRLDFIDATSLERRRELCEEEVRLNRRYASSLYLGVIPIVRTTDGLLFGGPGDAVEYAVQMRQFAPNDELHALIETNQVEPGEVSALAARLALAHSAAAVSTAPPPTRTLDFERIVLTNLTSIERDAALIGAQDAARALSSWMRAELSTREPRLQERERDGCVRECHGDLHARNVVRWQGALTPFDCIEFDDALRIIDTLSDAAFLLMDLMHLGRADLVYAFLNAYLEASGDYPGLDVLRCFLVHRALVRAKVDLIAVAQQAQAARERAAARFATAERLAQCATPLLILMHGASGSGKSWLSERLTAPLGAVRVRSDVERKRLAGVSPQTPRTARLDEGLYTRAINDQTYTRLAQCARASLRGGWHTIIDAAFLKHDERAAFAQIAREEGARFAIIACSADPQTLAARIEMRRMQARDPSDATQAVLERQLQTMRPLDPREASAALYTDTRESDVIETTLRALRDRLS